MIYLAPTSCYKVCQHFQKLINLYVRILLDKSLEDLNLSNADIKTSTIIKINLLRL
ncbi:hypothetical protein GLOIN_2v1604347 [Rhizophagus irregularis DAOM 181602=DAOM 197198]|uniref:Uncharacterized protein n=1 Tax=Rhizophagus irregularis (strain DAOM 181602 / DAOM 197198 / MUCL 43194) TaxID=747089 RepID=A0A2P4Q1W7_RHIID|nr:hypothetical protein GLOIN_2v1604347 [Rhizophagus irregularis DAOM 181602=DAOM 197198]POG71620.1 hypothetical protein GLOIN_2v1604347 [Rhizophagus irregularis DAOM 181602=DAOM 197198]|eukprot:XP_025178486.1 hypothetical protein GLOIN_2v1604347 [Rhizophagus irregularis DAOM 181602=DAOM 197198]